MGTEEIRFRISPTRFIQFLSNMTGWGLTDLDQRARRLKETKKLLPKGGRGRHAPHLTASHVVNMLISKLAAEEIGEAIHAVEAYILHLPEFHKAMGSIIADPELADRVEKIVISRSWDICPQASIHWKDRDEPDDYSPTDGAAEPYPIRVDVTIYRGLLHQIAIDLAEDWGPEQTEEEKKLGLPDWP